MPKAKGRAQSPPASPTMVWGDMERPVDDLAVFYKPRTLTVAMAAFAAIWYFGYEMTDEQNPEVNIKIGLAASAAAFLLFAVLQFPNGTFSRPHPAFWRFVLGWSILYLLLLVFAFFQTVNAGRQWLRYVDADLGVPEEEMVYAEHCEIFVWDDAKGSWTFPYLYEKVFDVFVVAHFVGWYMKALMLRDPVLCVVLSCSWELIEITFISMLPNFAECWWDQLILDIVLCNGLGMYMGLKTASFFEMRTYNWSGFKTLPTVRGKLKRAVQQFTPKDWTVVDWGVMEHPRRLAGVISLCICITIVELNAFFIKHALWIPSKHPLNSVRLGTWFFMGMPTLREFYLYLTNPRIKKLGTQAFVAFCVMLMELSVCIKFGRGMFDEMPPAWIISLWGLVIVALFLITLINYVRRHWNDKPGKKKRN